MNGRSDKAGQIINLISIVATNMEDYFTAIPHGFTSVSRIIASIYILAIMVSPLILSGIFLVLLTLLASIVLGNINQKLKFVSEFTLYTY